MSLEGTTGNEPGQNCRKNNYTENYYVGMGDFFEHNDKIKDKRTKIKDKRIKIKGKNKDKWGAGYSVLGPWSSVLGLLAQEKNFLNRLLITDY